MCTEESTRSGPEKGAGTIRANLLLDPVGGDALLS